MVAAITTSIAWIILAAVLLAWVLYALFNIRGSRRELGSEIELAANRKPYYDDEVLEGKKIERTQLLGLAFLAIITVSLPMYWVLEPAREKAAVNGYEKRFAKWGSQLFEVTANGGFNCAGCHGGMKATGGSAPFAITDPKTGEVKSVTWKAPALNTVFYRFSESEVTFILQYGRPFSPMSPWGLVGGGPMNDQQIQTLITYLKSIQVPREECTNPKEDVRTCSDGHLPAASQAEVQARAVSMVKSGAYKTVGEALFNLDLNGGAFACARCHTKGWSYGDPQVTGGGAFGPNLTGGSSIRQFPNQDDMITFIKGGSEFGKKYGEQGQGSGRMPAFGNIYTDEQIKSIVEYVRSL